MPPDSTGTVDGATDTEGSRFRVGVNLGDQWLRLGLKRRDTVNRVSQRPNLERVYPTVDQIGNRVGRGGGVAVQDIGPMCPRAIRRPVPVLIRGDSGVAWVIPGQHHLAAIPRQS